FNILSDRCTGGKQAQHRRLAELRTGERKQQSSWILCAAVARKRQRTGSLFQAMDQRLSGFCSPRGSIFQRRRSCVISKRSLWCKKRRPAENAGQDLRSERDQLQRIW